MNQQISHRITSLRWFCIVLVLLQHVVQWPYFEAALAPFSFEPFFSWLYMVMVYGIGIGVVPLFFIISGYLFFSRPRKFNVILLEKAKGLLLPMLLWTAIVCLAYLALSPWLGPLPQFAFLRSSSPLVWLKAIFGDYSHILDGSLGIPLIYQFWFIRDLIILALLSPLIDWLLHKAPWVYLSLCLLALAVNFHPLMEPHALLFFSLGGLCAIKDYDFFALADKWIPWPLVIVGCIAAVGYVHSLGLYCGITTQFLAHVPSFLLLLKVSKQLSSHAKLSAFLTRMAPQATFLYCAHGYMIMYLVGRLLVRWVDVSTTGGMMLFALLLFVAVLALCTAAGALLRRYLPRTFCLLCGGR